MSVLLLAPSPLPATHTPTAQALLRVAKPAEYHEIPSWIPLDSDGDVLSERYIPDLTRPIFVHESGLLAFQGPKAWVMVGRLKPTVEGAALGLLAGVWFAGDGLINRVKNRLRLLGVSGDEFQSLFSEAYGD